MAEDLNDFVRKIQLLKEKLTPRLGEIATILTLSAKALAERNILERGIDKQYSTEAIPVWFFKGKELNAAGTDYIEKATPKKGKVKKKKLEDITEEDLANGLGTWGEFRAAQGLQNAFVDLHYSNMMFSNMLPLDPVYKGNVVTVNLGATNREAQDKMNWNRDRYGDFIRAALTGENDKTLGDLVIGEVKKLIDEIKL